MKHIILIFTLMLSGMLYGQQNIQGAGASGSPVAGNPVLVGGSDGTNARTLQTGTAGTLAIGVPSTAIDGLANNSIVAPQWNGGNQATLLPIGSWLFNGTTWDRARSGPSAQTGAAPVGLLATSGSTVTYSPTQLGVNALSYASAGATAASTIIDMRGAVGWTLLFNCTSLVQVQINIYQEDGVTAFLNAAILTTSAASQTSISVNAGGTMYSTQGTPAASTPNLPQRAIAFVFSNTNTTAGTCTARLFVRY